MRLVSLEIHGFKSFAVAQKLVFPGGMTAVVGPNGCGKSNIADALAWVLGEQRVSLMRGTEMADVIFSGTSERKAMGMAEVKLALEMYDQSQPGTLSEVTVSRRLFRDTGSEYRINGRECRLKDIQELLMDTGMGTRAYSFIQQGQIDQILSTKPRDRRQLLEEAAGITRYKARRAETERRLEETRTNLERLDDILLEKKQQQDSLKRQAAKTRRAIDLEKEIEETQRILLTGKAMELGTAKEDVGRYMDSLKTEIAQLTAQAAEKASEVERMHLALAGQEKQYSEQAAQLAEMDSRLGLLEQERGFKSQMSERSMNEISQIKQRIAKLEKDGDSDSLASEIKRLEESKEIAQKSLESSEQRVKEAEGAVAMAIGALRAIESNLKLLQAKRDGALQMSIQQQKARQAIQGQISQIEGRLETLNHEEAMRAPELGRLVEELKTLSSAIEGAEERCLQMDEAIAVQARLRDEAVEASRACERSHRETKGALDACGLRINQLSDALKLASRSMASEKTIEWLKAKGINPTRLIDAIKIDEEARPDLERLLGSWISAVAWKMGGQLLPQLPGQLMASIEYKSSPVEPPANVRPIAASIRWQSKAPKVLNGLLARTFRCSDDAFAEMAAKHPELAFVSPSLVKLPFGPVQAGVEPPAASPLKMMAELDASRAERETLQDAFESFESQKVALAAKESEARERYGEMEDDRNIAKRSLEEKKGQRASVERQIKEIEEAQQRADSLWESFEQDIANLRQKLKEMDKEDPESQAAALEGEISAAEESKSGAQSHLDNCRDDEVKANNERAAAWSERDRAERELQYQQRAMFNREAEEKRLAAECVEAEKQKRDADGRVAEIDREVQILLADRSKNIKKQTGAQPKIEKAKEEARAHERMASEFREALENARQLHQESTVRAANVDGHLEAVAKEVELTLGMTVPDFLNSITPLEKEAWDQGELVHQTRLSELQSRRLDLGSVNPLAIQELEEVESTLSFKNEQRADVLESIADLEATIKLINSESEERFREAFDFINARFQEVFRQVFVGGSAHLSLQDPKDLLECGIEITAQPPGKTAKVLTLLSGGEKALTAISLLFAIFHFKPSPFCVLDEVDAPLDEANVARFAMLVGNMKQHTQFIVITHQKPTMIAADTLYGVTMEEKGISRLVSVQLKEAEKYVQ
jgi:chromosome segregation protein